MRGDARLASALEGARLAGDLGAMEIAVENFNAWYDRRERRAREHGLAQGLEGQRALLLRQAALKFDGEMAALRILSV